MSLLEPDERASSKLTEAVQPGTATPFLLADLPRGWFERDSKAVLLVDSTGLLIDANPAASTIIRDAKLVQVRQGRLFFSKPATEAAFRSHLADTWSDPCGRSAFLAEDRAGEWRRVEIVEAGHGLRRAFVSFGNVQTGQCRLDPDERAFGLTSTESKILQCLLDDKPPKEVARELNVAERTVRTHLRNIYLKMNVRGLSSAIRKAVELLK